jgi:streptogramin lyase
MRISFSAMFSASAIVALCGLSAPAAPAKGPDARSSKASHAKAGPSNGIKTPGVQIPFGNIKPAIEIPVAGKPAWIYASNSAFVPQENGLSSIDPKTNVLTAPISGLDDLCAGMVSAFGSLWTPSCKDGSLARLNSKDMKVSARLPIGAAKVAGGITASADSIWLLTDGKTTLSRIDPDRNVIVAEMRLPVGCRGLMFGEDALWIACPSENQVFRINPATNLVEKRIDVSAEPEAVAVGEKSVWVYCRKDGKVERIDPKTNKVSKTVNLETPGAEGAIAAGEGSIWVTLTGFPLTRIDPVAESVAQQFYGEGGGGVIATGAGALWLADSGKGVVQRIDPKLVSLTLAE